MQDNAGFAYERLEQRLPLKCAKLEMAEVDTEADLEKARVFAKTGNW